VNNFKLDDTRIKTIGLPKKAEMPAGQVEIMIYPAPAAREAGKH
jgi:hypothetical protein